MELIRCDRCQIEYDGTQCDLWLPSILEKDMWPNESDHRIRYDLCHKCRKQFVDVICECREIMNIFLSRRLLKLEREFSAKWASLSIDSHV